MDRRELLIGCGNSREKRIMTRGVKEWDNLTTLDIDPNCKPDILFDLESLGHSPLPFEDNTFNEIHAYEVLEHFGRQGDWRGFFKQFEELYRVLKPNGFLAGSCPKWDSCWAWGDPGHTRVIGIEQFAFLSQPQYSMQIGKTAMTDYRYWYSGDMDLGWVEEQNGLTYFVLGAIKPSRRWAPVPLSKASGTGQYSDLSADQLMALGANNGA